MLMLDAIAERRIREAQERGDFDDLPGTGSPLELDDDALVPEELRAAYRLLRNAGYLTPELAASREIRDLEQLLVAIDDTGGRARVLARISFLMTRGGLRRDLRLEQDYFERVARRLARDSTFA